LGLRTEIEACGLRVERAVRPLWGGPTDWIARKLRTIENVDVPAAAPRAVMPGSPRVIAVLPAYNAARTLRRTVADIPRSSVDQIILVDDVSRDDTVRIARELGLTVVCHEQNRGYGGNQKTCYRTALEQGADIAVMVHPDYQYDPRIIPQLIEPILSGRADAVFGSRMMKGGALEGGMPLWKHNANILLTAFENVMLGTYLTEYHSGFRAYSSRLLRTVRFEENSDNFIFDTEIIVQALIRGFRIEEVPIQTRYFDEASSIRLWPSIRYGLGILKAMTRHFLHVRGIWRSRQFEPATNAPAAQTGR
jgi:glycosyltransferase involved in cell wall biosynthesis